MASSAPVGDNKVDILILGAGWVSHFLIPLLGPSHLTYAATSRSGLTPGTLAWSLGDSTEGLPSASTVVLVFPINEWGALKELVEEYTRIHGEGTWVLLGSTRGWQTADSDPSGTIVTRHTPLPPDAPSRSLVEQKFLETFPDRGIVLNLVGLHGSPPVSGDVPHCAPRLVPNFLKRVAGTKDALRQKASVHFVHGSDVARAILLVHQKGRNAVGRWIVSDGLVRDWWAIALELGTEQEKGWVLELMREEGVKVLPRQKGLGRIIDGSEFWMELGGMPGYIGLSV